MPRKPRLHVSGGFYHVILRGNHREPLFRTPGDRSYLNVLVGDVADRFELRILAYCWMTNHLHMALRVGDCPLAKPMQRLAMRFSRHIHADAGQVGHLFERRFRAILVDADSYLLALVRYIHLNPVVAGMVTDPWEYRWSSHRDYLGRATAPWVDTDFVLRMFGPTIGVARARYGRFMRSSTGDDLKLFESHESRDTRALEPDPVRVTTPATRSGPVPAGSVARESLDQIAARLCASLGISVTELVAPSRERRLSRTRTALAREALAAGAATVSEIARFLGRSPSALAQSLALAEIRNRTEPRNN